MQEHWAVYYPERWWNIAHEYANIPHEYVCRSIGQFIILKDDEILLMNMQIFPHKYANIVHEYANIVHEFANIAHEYVNIPYEYASK